MSYILTSKRYGFQLSRNIINKIIGKTIHFAFEVQIVFTHYFCLEKVVQFQFCCCFGSGLSKIIKLYYYLSCFYYIYTHNEFNSRFDSI